jgi:hypothetical protein
MWHGIANLRALISISCAPTWSPSLHHEPPPRIATMTVANYLSIKQSYYMAYKKLTRRSYKIIKITIWLLPVVNSTTCKSWYITKCDHRIHYIYHTHHILWQYNITNTPYKNKLDASNLLIACFTWLIGAMLKNGSYLRKATTLILGLPKSCCKSVDTHHPHVWSKPHVKCGAGLMNAVM